MNKEVLEVSFREDQKPIMQYTGGTMAVPAVPGAGKTFIVANLAAKIIEEKRQRPGKVLVVTYMNSAVNNFKSRISSVLNDKGISAVNSYEVMTIHSLAMKILRDRPDIVGINEEFGVIDDIRKSFYLNECINEWRRRGGERIFRSFLSDYGTKKYEEKGSDWWKSFFSVVDILISELKLNDISPERLKDMGEDFEEIKIIRSIAYIYEIYTQKLKLEGYIDYNDLLILSYKALLRDEKLREKFQNRYSFIFEDECQDSNLVQCKMLALLSGNNNNLVRVGDVNQSIMGTFTSSDPSFFSDFCDQVDKKYVMNMAGRSSKQIIDLANHLVSYTREYQPEEKCRGALADQKIAVVSGMKDFKNPEIDGNGIYTYSLSSWNKVKETTLKGILNFRSKYPDKTIGVLVPFNNHVSEIAKELRRMNIECDELSTSSEKRIKVTNTLGYVLGFLGEPDNIYKFKALIDSLIEENSDEKELLMKFILNHKVEEIAYLDFSSLLQESLRCSDIFKKLKEKINIIRNILEYNQNSLDNLILYISSILNLSIEDKAMAQAVASYVKFQTKNNPDLTIEEISEELLDNKNSVFRHIADVIYDLQGYEPVPGRVTVATCHKSKGLEWDCVFLLCLTDYNYPTSLSGKFRTDYFYFKDEFRNPIAVGKSEIQRILGESVCRNPFLQAKIDVVNEKIRLLYVGITRAKEYLVLMAHQEGEGNRRDKPSKYFTVLKEFIERNKLEDGNK